MDTDLQQRYGKYIEITERALGKAKEAPENLDIHDGTRADFLDMIQRYVDDAKHFHEKGDIINAFAAITYAHGWLDAGARIGLWDVHDSLLFTVDDNKPTR
jgi:hypothetical protein